MSLGLVGRSDKQTDFLTSETVVGDLIFPQEIMPSAINACKTVDLGNAVEKLDLLKSLGSPESLCLLECHSVSKSGHSKHWRLTNVWTLLLFRCESLSG